MAAPCYITWNGVVPTSTPWPPVAAVATSASANTPKTMLQLKPGTPKVRIIEWGYSFTAVPTAAVQVELLETGTVAATVTAAVSAGVINYNDVTGPASQASLGVSATGYTSSAEGTITTSRVLAYQYELGVQFKQQFPLGREPEVNGGSILRIRATPTTAAATSISCYIIWEE